MPSITRRTRGSRAARRDEIRGRLLEVVERLLDGGESYAEISIERIVSEASISRSTFYVYFEDKGDLLLAWFAEITEGLEEAAKDWWRLGPGVTEADLLVALDRVVRTYAPHTQLMAAMFDAASYDPAVRQPVMALMEGNMAGLRKHIRVGQREGFIDPAVHPEQTAAWLTWMAERGFHQLVRGASPNELTRLIQTYTHIVWNTLYAPAA